MSIAECYSITVQCDGPHEPGLLPRGDFNGNTKREAHAELRRAGWSLGPDFTAYCRKCIALARKARAGAANHKAPSQ